MERDPSLIGPHYSLQYVIVSHEPGGWNFSENTSLSECLLVAKRLQQNEETSSPTKFVNLWQKPKTSIEALTVAELIKNATGVFLETDKGIDELRTDSKKFGEVILCPPEHIQAAKWEAEVAFAQTDLCRTAYFLARGKTYIPGKGKVGNIPLISLTELGVIGPDRRDIHDGFRISNGSTSYPAFWGHETESVQKMEQEPNKYLSALARAHRGRHLRDPHLLWSRAGSLLIAERLRLNTVRVVSIRIAQKVLSNTWWPFSVSDNLPIPSENVERILVLWLNSTFGIISLIAARVDTEGAWVELKKPILQQLYVLNPMALTKGQRGILIDAYDKLSDRELSQLPRIDNDETRYQIDKAICRSLGIKDDVSVLRRMLSKEPILRS